MQAKNAFAKKGIIFLSIFFFILFECSLFVFVYFIE